MAQDPATAYFEAPTTSPAVPNPAFTQAVYIETSYTFTSHAKSVKLILLDLKSKHTKVLIEDDNLSPPCWLDDFTLVWLHSRPSGTTSVAFWNIRDANEWPKSVAGVIPGPASDLKLKPLKKQPNTWALAFSAKVNTDGSIYNPVEEEAKAKIIPHTAKYFKANYVRHWNEWTVEHKNTILYTALHLIPSEQRLVLSNIENACPKGLASPVAPFGGADHFDICETGIVFVARDPTLDFSLHTKCDVYFSPVERWVEIGLPTRRLGHETIKVLDGGKFNGWATSPTIAPNNKTLAFLKQERDGFESDKYHIMVVEEFSGQEARVSDPFVDLFDHEIVELIFVDNNSIFALADHRAESIALLLKWQNGPSSTPVRTPHGYTAAARFSAQGKCLYTSNDLEHSFVIWGKEIDDDSKGSVEKLSSMEVLSESGSKASSFQYQGSNQATKLHCLVMKPPNFQESKKHPVCFMIHGGPQDCFRNSWSNYFNLRAKILADSGYVVFLPNIIGSRGYGQKLMDEIQNNWGGGPYEDIVALFEYVKDSFPWADTSRAILGGLSYGGYMTNWIQGHDFGREFKALFTLNGLYSTNMFMDTEELFFIRADFGGLPWESKEARDNWSRWDPSNFIDKWATPHIIVHTEKDFRVPISHGIAAFNVLQAKGIPSAFLKFEDEAHLMEGTENLRALHQAVLTFVNPYVGLPVPKLGAGEERIVAIR